MTAATLGELAEDEIAVLRAIHESDYGLTAKAIADALAPAMKRRRIDTLLDRLSDLGYLVSGWHPVPGAAPTDRPFRHWRLSATGVDGFQR